MEALDGRTSAAAIGGGAITTAAAGSDGAAARRRLLEEPARPIRWLTGPCIEIWVRRPPSAIADPGAALTIA